MIVLNWELEVQYEEENYCVDLRRSMKYEYENYCVELGRSMQY